MLYSIFAIIFLFISNSLFAQLSPVYNLSFEKKGINLPVPINWEVFGNQHDLFLDSLIIKDGKYSIKAKSKAKKTNIDDAVFIVNRISSHPFAGNTLKLIGDIKTENSRNGFAQIYILVLKNGYTIQSAYSWEQRISGTTDWTKNEISLKIDSSSDQILIGAMFRGSGQAWFDAFQLYKNDVTIDENKLFPNKLNSSELEWLNRHIITLPEMVSAEVKDQPHWEKYFGDAKIIGLGEFTHGSSEVFSAKAGIIKYLIENNQLELIAWESGMVKAEIFNKCLLNKDCDIKAALYKMISSPWNNDEVLDLLQWIQNYNITADKKVTFAGFDMQDYRPAHKRLIHFATATNNKILVKKLKKYTEVQEKAYKESHKESGFNYATPKTAKVMKKQANEIKKAFSNIKDSAWINQYVELLYQYAQMWSSKDYDTINIMRDSFMAQNMIYLHSLYPGKKTVIWAHNGHISNAKEWMGSYLKKEFGNEYLIIGFSSRAGNYSSWKSLCYLTPPDPRCFEYFFPQNNFLLSLKDARSDATGDAKWLNEIKLFRNSTGKSDTQFDPSILVNEFDYIYHIKKTTASKDFID